MNKATDEDENLVKRIDSFIKCQRCKKYLKYCKQKLLMNKNNYKSVCNHCINEYLLYKSNKSRIDRKTARIESSSRKFQVKVKLWLTKIIDLMEKNRTLLGAANLSKQARHYSKLSLYRSNKISLKNIHEPEIDVMFRTTEDINQTCRIIHYKNETRRKVNNEIVSPLETCNYDLSTSSAVCLHEQPNLLQCKLQILKKEICDANEVQIKKKYRSKSCHEGPYIDVILSKRTSKDSSIKDKTENLDNLFDDLSSKNINRIYSKSMFSNIQSSAELQKSSILNTTDKSFEDNFSYLFPKVNRVRQATRLYKNSSEIVKEVMEMLSERAKVDEKKKKEDRKTKKENKGNKTQGCPEKIAPQTDLLNNLKKKGNTKVDGQLKGIEEKRSVNSQNIKSEIKSSESVLGTEKLKREATKRKEERSVFENSKNIKDNNYKEKYKVKNERKNSNKTLEINRPNVRQQIQFKKEEKNDIFTKENQRHLQKKEQSLHILSGKKNDEVNTKQNEKKYTEDSLAEVVKVKERESKTSVIGKLVKENKLKEKIKVRQKEKYKSSKIQEEPIIKELSISKVKLRKPSTDDLILQLVRIKQSEGEQLKQRPRCLSTLNISPIIFERHRGHKLHHCMHGTHCVICENSELELDIDNIIYNEHKREEQADIIIGSKIRNFIPNVENPTMENILEPLFFRRNYQSIQEDNDKKTGFTPAILKQQVEKEAAKGAVRYTLSDRAFIDKGWTILPTEKVVRQIYVYRMRPAHPELNWFEYNKNKKFMLYDTGEKLAEFDKIGKGRWFYRNGRIALDYYEAEEINAQQRFVVYSNGKPDERGRSRPSTVLATFDYLGNGIVFDHSGKIRLKYNQTEGVVLDRNIGPESHWKWHTLNDPPVLQKIMIDTQLTQKDPDILKFSGPGDDMPKHDNEEMVLIEFDNFIKEKNKKLSQKFEPYQIKMKVLKINENFTLKVLSQAKVYLIFRDGSTNLKLNIGMILDHKEIIDTDIAAVGEVFSSLERFPASSTSLAGLQQSIAHTQRIERARLERRRRLHLTQPYASADKLIAGSSPLRPQIRTVPSDTTNVAEYRCRCKKPSTKNIYYDTRLA